MSSAGLVVSMYLTIATNFLDPMFPCEIRQKLIDNRFAKHIVILMVAFFWAAPDAQYDEGFTIREHARNTLFIYLLYLASCKCATTFLLPALGLLVVERGLALYSAKGGMDDAEHTRRRLRTVALVLITVGCVANASTTDNRAFTIRCPTQS
jgi:hypothetical protein